MPSLPLRPRLLLVEDDAGRIQHVTEWLAGTKLATSQQLGKQLGDQPDVGDALLANGRRYNGTDSR